MKAVVGFDRKLKRDWLDHLADQAAKGEETPALRKFLDELLKTAHPGRTARRKTITVLMRIWALVPDEDLQLRQDAFDLLRVIPARDRIWLHWGMSLLAYPLFRDATTAIGRLLKLQGEFTLGQLQRKLIDGWGERSTVTRALQRIVRSLVEWEVLADARQPGHFQAAPLIATNSTPLQLWFVRACLQAGRSESVEADQLLSQPFAFPFKLTIKKPDLRRSKAFTIHRQGIDMDMVAVANTSASTSTRTPRKHDSRQQLMVHQD
jgi:hypothetical protein